MNELSEKHLQTLKKQTEDANVASHQAQTATDQNVNFRTNRRKEMKDTNVLSDTNAAVDVNWLEQLLRSAGKLFQDRTLAGQTREKGVADYVTAVDYEVQQYIRIRLEEQYPHIQFLSEEKSNDDVDRSGIVWVLDPVDGTTNLIHDYQASVISLALMDKGESVLWMIYDPYMNELFLAEKGKGSFCNGRRIHVSRAASMAECLIAIGTSPYYKELAEKNFDLFRRIFMDCQDVRRSGSAARDLAYVACGRLDGYLEQRLKIWDFAAGMLLVREAGGCIRDYQGEDLGATMIGDMVAANSVVTELIKGKYLKTE